MTAMAKRRDIMGKREGMMVGKREGMMMGKREGMVAVAKRETHVYRLLHLLQPLYLHQHQPLYPLQLRPLHLLQLQPLLLLLLQPLHLPPNAPSHQLLLRELLYCAMCVGMDNLCLILMEPLKLNLSDLNWVSSLVVALTCMVKDNAFREPIVLMFRMQLKTLVPVNVLQHLHLPLLLFSEVCKRLMMLDPQTKYV
jgi:hypothetical protein